MCAQGWWCVCLVDVCVLHKCEGEGFKSREVMVDSQEIKKSDVPMQYFSNSSG